MPPDLLDEGNDEQQSQGDMELLERNMERGGEQQEPEADEPVVVQLNDGEGEEDDDEPSLSRKEKKRQRYREMAEARERAEREASELRVKLAAQEAAAEAVRNSMPRHQPEPGPDPDEQAFQEVLDEQTRLYEEYQSAQAAKTLTPEKDKEFQRRARDLEQRKIDARIAALQKRNRPDPTTQYIQARHADVMANERAVQYANSLYQGSRAKGVPHSNDLIDHCMETTREVFKIGQRQRQRSPEERSRYTGAPAGSGRSGSGRQERGSVTVSPEQRKMAQAAYPNLDPQKAVQKWANEVGRHIK